MKVQLRPAPLLAALAASLLSVACGGTTSPDPDAAAITPAPAAAANLAVTWSVQEGSTGGSVSTGGLYTAPGTAGTYHVVVRSVGDTTKSATATVTVTGAAQQVAISVSPSSASVTTGGTVQLAATVTGTSNTSVNWSVVEGSAGGSVSGGVYTAPATAGTYHVRAQSQADTTKTAQATITVTGGGSQPVSSCTTAPMSGTVYYYCDCATGVQGGNPDAGCVAGNDSNPGTSPSAPRRSLADAQSRFNSMGAGNTVALCRGGTWSGGGIDFTNTACTASAPCYWRDYAPSWGQGANNNRPRIGGSNTMLAVQNSPRRGNYRIWGMDVRNPAQGGANGVVLVYNTQVTNVDFCNLRVDGGWLGVYFEPQNTDDTKLSLRDSQIYNGQFSGFYGGGPGVNITGNYFEGNGIGSGSGGMLDHSAYLISEIGGYPTEPSTPIPYVFSNNEIVQGSYCDGVMLVVHGVFRNNHLVIENNYLHSPSTKPQCYGFQTAGGLAGAEFRNVSFRRNRVDMVSGTGVEYSCCADCNFSDNVFTGSGVSFATGDCNAGSFTGGKLTIQNNTFYGVGMSIGSQGSGPYDMDNNVAWLNSGTCFSVARNQGRNNNNYCRTGSGAAATALFVNPSAGDFTPVAGGPLDGAGSSNYYSSTAIGSVTWSKSDAGVARSAPIDIGAFQR